MSLIAKDTKKENSKTERTVQTPLLTLALALKGGEERIKRIQEMAFNMPAKQGAEILGELKQLETLLQAVGRALADEQ